MKPSYLTLDTLSDRRDVHGLLHRLDPRGRVAFLEWACSQVAGVGGNRPVPLRMGRTVELAYRCGRADDRLTNEIYTDVLALAANWGLDLEAAAVELERVVRTPGGRVSSGA